MNLHFHKYTPKIFALHFHLFQHTSLCSFPQLLVPHHHRFRYLSRLPTALFPSFLISAPFSKSFLKTPLHLLGLSSAPLPTLSCFPLISPPPPGPSYSTSCVKNAFLISNLVNNNIILINNKPVLGSCAKHYQPQRFVGTVANDSIKLRAWRCQHLHLCACHRILGCHRMRAVCGSREISPEMSRRLQGRREQHRHFNWCLRAQGKHFCCLGSVVPHDNSEFIFAPSQKSLS